jgi:hypothetical protein
MVHFCVEIYHEFAVGTQDGHVDGGFHIPFEVRLHGKRSLPF